MPMGLKRMFFEMDNGVSYDIPLVAIKSTLVEYDVASKKRRAVIEFEIGDEMVMHFTPPLKAPAHEITESSTRELPPMSSGK